MATELGLLSSTQLQNLAHQSQQNQPSPSAAAAWMLNPKQAHTHEDDDSWELRAFAEDTGNIMGTTWPPRSYTCTFCRREFRSAQALGGHMNVHRRDRAGLRHQSQLPPPPPPPPACSSSSTNGEYCLLYQLPNPNGAFTSTTVTACAIESPTTTTLLSFSPYPPPNKLLWRPANFPVPPTRILSSTSSNNNNESAIEEVDLELRLGH